MSFTGPDGNQPLTRREAREREARLASAVTPASPPAPPAPPAVRAMTPSRVTVVVRRKAAPKKKRFGAQLLSMGALLFAAALLVGTTVPANAFISTDVQLDAAPKATEGQSVEVSEIAIAADATRADYTVTSYAEQLRQKYGNRSYSYKVGVGPVQWPFPYAVPISDGFGERLAPCRYCSSFHTGVDFTPGAGTPIYSIAAGTVVFTEVSNSGFGNQVKIEHTIGGKKITSMYAHMQANSSPLQVGQVIEVGEFVGLVGSTGVATGAHLHLEVHVNGEPTDPFVWLKANAAK
jgi:murein DD-endopeptidase MepM/ murein hydrolase activator NlpD